MIKKILLLSLLFSALLFGDKIKVVTAEDYTFAEVADGVKTSIEEQGLIVKTTMYLHKMLTRTATKDNKVIYEDAVAHEFCSASLTREFALLDGRNIANCPYAISIYQLKGQKDIQIAYKVPEIYSQTKPEKAKQLEQKIDNFLKTIIEDAL